MAGEIGLNQDAVLKMIGEREVRIVILGEQLSMAGGEVQRLQAQLTGCKCVTKLPVRRTEPPSGEGEVRPG